MCGIAGIETEKLSSPEREQALARMNQAMLHRGPDDGGEHHWQTLSIGQRRLSIIDISQAGHQPIANEDESLWLVANGEIYNFKELGESLLQRGHRFRSKTDTEMILHLYEEYGTGCVHHLRGMFAFVLLDKKNRRLFLARDRLGIKPLYYALSSCGFLFGSEIKTLLASGLIKPRLNLTALDHYLAMGYLPPTESLIEGIQPLLPGHWMIVDQGKIRQERYWDLPLPETRQLDPRGVMAELRSLLEESVALHRVSDVPLGAFLSGGIDSSAIVGLMSRSVIRPIKTFSVGFQDGPARLNELPYASIVAKRFKTDHQEILMSGKEVSNNLDAMVTAIDQPSFDGINSYLISQAARQGGLTVALSGLGGDELFGGYNIFKFLPRMARWTKPWSLLPRPLKKIALRGLALGVTNPQRVSKLRRFTDVNDPLDLYGAIRFNLWGQERTCLYSLEAQQSLETSQDYQDPLAMLRSFHTTNGNGWQLTTRMEINSFMIWRLLRDTDAMSMAHSLEVRVPFVDHKIVEFICRLPIGWEKRWGFPKKLLVETLSDILPKEILNRPKQGFQFPMGEWMRHELKPVVEDVFSESSLENRGLFGLKPIQDLYHQFQQGLISYEVIWQFVILELWMRKWLPSSVLS